jgi:hypothetical protein
MGNTHLVAEGNAKELIVNALSKLRRTKKAARIRDPHQPSSPVFQSGASQADDELVITGGNGKLSNARSAAAPGGRELATLRACGIFAIGHTIQIQPFKIPSAAHQMGGRFALEC